MGQQIISLSSLDAEASCSCCSKPAKPTPNPSPEPSPSGCRCFCDGAVTFGCKLDGPEAVHNIFLLVPIPLVENDAIRLSLVSNVNGAHSSHFHPLSTGRDICALTRVLLI
jgi:hypothetical protein